MKNSARLENVKSTIILTCSILKNDSSKKLVFLLMIAFAIKGVSV